MKKGKNLKRRMLAFVLAIALVAGLVPNSIIAKAAETCDVTVNFEFTRDTDVKADDVTIAVKKVVNADTTEAVQTTKDDADTLTFTGEEGKYVYEMTSEEYALPLTGEFEVAATDDELANAVEGENVAVTEVVKVESKIADVEGQYAESTVKVNIDGVEEKDITITVTAVCSGKSYTAKEKDGVYVIEKLPINKEVTVTATASEKYVTSEKTVTTNVEEQTVDMTMAVQNFKFEVKGYDNNISKLTVDGNEVTSLDAVPYGTTVKVELTDVSDRCTATIDGEEKLSAEYTVTSDTSVEIAYETVAEVKDVACTTSDWTNKEVVISGTVEGLTGDYSVYLIKKDGGATVDSCEADSLTDGEFEFTVDTDNVLVDTYQIKVVDDATGLSIIVNSDGTLVQIDKVAPVIDSREWSEDVYTVGDTVWAKDGATYTIEASDADSDINSDSSEFTFKVSGDAETVVTEIEKTLTVYDNAGNSTPETVKYNYDSKAPVITESDLTNVTNLKEIEKDAAAVWMWNGEEIVIPVVVPEDDGCGLESYSYVVKKNGDAEGNYLELTNPEIKITNQLVEYEQGATYTVDLVAIDNLGNETEETTIATFVSDSEGPEVSFEFAADTSLVDKIKDFFGLYHNTDIKVTVTATDDGVGFAGMGYEDIFGNGLIYNETATVELDDSEISDDTATATYIIKLAEDAITSTVSIDVKDAFGNGSSVPAKRSDIQDGLGDTELQIMLESIRPVINDPDFDTATYSEVAFNNTKLWFKNMPVNFVYEITDADSGLNTINVTCNGNSITADMPELTKAQVNEAEVKFTITSDMCDETGKCEVVVEVVDNAGNDNSATETIYFDVDAPVISKVTFKNAEAVKESATVVEGDFGYFFKEATTAYFEVTDYIGDTKNVGSGIATVEYSLGENGTKESATYVGENTYSFDIPEGYKGHVYIYAADNVGYTDQVDPTELEGVILEAQGTHNKNSETAITLSPAKTQYRDANGLPLYPTKVSVSAKVKQTFSGIESATYKSNVNGTKSFTGNIDSENGYDNSDFTVDSSEANIVTGLSTTDSYDGEQNGIELSLVSTCNSNHTDKDAEEFSVDTDGPNVTVTWNDIEVHNEKYYNEDRVATITVRERNFDSERCNFVITGPTPAISSWSHDGDIHTATVRFSADGDYTFSFNMTDMAGHKDDYNNKVDEFTVDQTAPVISVVYDNNSYQNGFYYQNARTATVTIDEHNFRASEVEAHLSANDNGASVAVPSVDGWSSSNDNNVATIDFDYDAEFTFSMDYEDLAGNPAETYGEDHFVVDLTNPVLEIYDVENETAYNDVIAPGVRYTDTNVDGNGFEMSLVGANNGSYNPASSRSVSANTADLKYADFPHDKEVDDMYVLHARVVDLSGRPAEAEVVFSVNRFGSVYVLDDATQKLVTEKDGYTNQEQVVGIREINVDLLTSKEVSVARDGDMSKLVEGTDYTVNRSGSKTTWKEYYYKLNAENFSEEGNYSVTVFSEDEATNTQDNKNNKRNEECNVEFVIDKTAPSTVVSGIEDGEKYDEVEQKFQVNAKDNILLDKVVMEIDGETYEYDSNDISATGDLELAVANAQKWQDVKVYSVDKAGNSDKDEVDPLTILVSADNWVLFINDTPLVVGTSVSAAAVAGGLFWFFFIWKRRKDDEEEENAKA